MIIFDLDGTLANCEHRRHFVDKNKTWCKECHKLMSMEPTIDIQCLNCGNWPTKWKPDWQSFYEACDKDEPIYPVLDLLRDLSGEYEIQIWSGRCKSVEDKTRKWLTQYGCWDFYSDRHCPKLKMRPIGDSTPDHEIKERWLDAYILNLDPPLKPMSEDGIMDESVFKRNPPIEFVFDDRPKVVRMWRKRGIFVFDCNQDGREF